MIPFCDFHHPLLGVGASDENPVPNIDLIAVNIILKY